MNFEVSLQFLLAIGIGAIIGLEREIIHQKEKVEDFAGVRNFILIAILGAILGYLSFGIFDSLILLILGFSTFVLLVISAYIMSSKKTKRINLTTSLAAIITFILGFMTTLNLGENLKRVAIILAIIVASLLALKEQLHKFAKKTKMIEMFAAIKFAIIAVVILPFLPNKNYVLTDIPLIDTIVQHFPKFYSIVQQLDVFNPYIIWLMVVFIASLSFIGYILIKTIGLNKGIGLTSFLGGLVSSTAVTVTLSNKSKQKKIFRTFAFGIILANIVMLLRILVEVIVINNSLLKLLLLPLGSMALTGIIGAGVILYKKEERKEKIELKNPFAFMPALKFGIFFGFILAVSKLLNLLYGAKGIYFASILSGLADVDAITITLSSLSSSAGLEPSIAATGIILAACSNIFVKGSIAFLFASKKVSKTIITIFSIMLLVGLLTVFFI